MGFDTKQHRQCAHAVTIASFQTLESRQLLAAVSINANQSLRTIDPRLSGVNLAWWQYEMNTSQMKSLVNAAGLKLMRLPGGSAADEFHFTAPAPYNGYDTLPIMANFVQAAGADSIVTVDYGSAGPEEAAAMMSYLNAPVGSTVSIGNGQTWDSTANAWVTKDFQTAGYWASLRAARPLATDDGLNFLRVNHPAPWSFSYYEIGNEEYATWETDHHSSTGKGGTSPSTYIGFAKSLQTLAAQIDPKVKIGIDVSPALKYNMPDAAWTSDLLTQSAAQGFAPGFLSDHIYVTGLSDQNLLLHSVNDPAFKQDNYNSSWSGRASFYRSLINAKLGTSAGAGVQLMATEFNSDINTKQAANLVGGLWTADALAGLSQTEYTGAVQWDLTNGYNALSTPDTTHYGWRQGVDEGLFGTGSGPAPATGAYVPYPTYFAQQLFSKLDLTGGSVIPVSGNDPNLSTYAVKEANGHVRLLVINKSATSAITGTFSFSGFFPSTSATQWQYGTAEDTAQSLTTDGHSSLTTSTPTLSGSSSSVSQSFPFYSMTVLDLAPAAPAMISSAFNYATAPNTVSFTFNQPLAPASVSTSDLVLANLSDGAIPTVPSYSLSTDGLTVTFSLAAVPDGNYTATLPVGSISSTASAVANTTAAAASFFSLAGDANHDGTVDVIDLGILSSNWQKTGMTFAQGDLNHDGMVDVVDLGILSSNWQKTIAPPVVVNPTIIKSTTVTPIKKIVPVPVAKPAALASVAVAPLLRMATI